MELFFLEPLFESRATSKRVDSEMKPQNSNHNGRVKRPGAENEAREQHGDHREQQPPIPKFSLWFRDRSLRSLLNHRWFRSVRGPAVQPLAWMADPPEVSSSSSAGRAPRSSRLATRTSARSGRPVRSTYCSKLGVSLP